MRLLALLLCFVALSAEARSTAQVNAFKRANPCPSTGARSGPCSGFIVDHRVPLCAGGADHPSNMQYQTVDEAKRKDVQERNMCREMKR